LKSAKCPKIQREKCSAALQWLSQTFTPHGGNGYAVSVLTDRGNIYEGVSYKSDTMTLTMHCEMTALARGQNIESCDDDGVPA